MVHCGLKEHCMWEPLEPPLRTPREPLGILAVRLRADPLGHLWDPVKPLVPLGHLWELPWTFLATLGSPLKPFGTAWDTLGSLGSFLGPLNVPLGAL